MTAPTLLDFVESNYTDTSLTETTAANLDWSASGNIAVVLGVTEDNAQTIGTPAATGLTFAALSGSPSNAASSCKAYGWSAIASGSGSSTVTATGAGGTAHRGISAWAFSGTGGLTAFTPVVSAALTMSITLSGPDSTVLMILGDWNASTDVTVDTVPSGGTIRRATNISGAATFIVAEWTGQAAGTRSYGVANWAGTGTITKLLAEVQGIASAAASLVIPNRAQTGALLEL